MLMPRLLIILREPLSHLARSDPHNGVCTGVVIGRSVKNRMSEGTFLQLFKMTGDCAFHDPAKKTGISLAVSEVRALQKEFHMLPNNGNLLNRQDLRSLRHGNPKNASLIPQYGKWKGIIPLNRRAITSVNLPHGSKTRVAEEL
jgi:hypothetical protein